MNARSFLKNCLSLKLLFYGLFLLIFSAGILRAEENPPVPPLEIELDIEELEESLRDEAKSELMSLKLGDSDVSLSVAGYWKGTLQGNLGLALTPLGTQIVSPDSPVLFTQEADLTLDLRIRDRWFVEASFLDDYAINTYRAGYEGASGAFVQYAGIGNTGLDFPAFPYLDLGGDSPSSFGYYGHFGGGALNFHTLFRWDQAAREQRIFVGNRERGYVYLSPDNSARGLSFVLPDENIDSGIQVFLEDVDGELRDENNKRWRLAEASEYAAGRVSGLVELSKSPEGMVAVAYSKTGDPRPWNFSLGEYGDLLTPGSGFLGAAQNHFGGKIMLSGYPQSGETSGLPGKPGSREINGTPALVVFEPGAFSPFERRSRYEAPSSATTDAALVTLSSLQRISGFEIIEFEASVLSADIPLYAQNETARGFFELVKEGKSADNRDPFTRWPLAEKFAEIYLPGSSPSAGDIGLRFTNYGNSGAYSIGTDVVPGSVQVWRSGIMDSQFSYNSAAGTVSLSNPAGFSEVIRITYLKRSGDAKLGSIAAGLGAVYHEEESPFSSEMAIGLRWNLNSGDTFTEEGVSNPGTVGLGAKTSWDFENFTAQITAGLGFEQPDSTGLYRGAGMEGNEIILGLPADSAFLSHPPASVLFPNLLPGERADLVYRNYRDSATLGNTLMTIDWGGSRIVSGENRPYPVRDPSLTREANALTAEFEFKGGLNWTGFEVPLGSDSSALARAKEIEVPFRFYGFDFDTPLSGFNVILQIGALSGEDYAFAENPALILEKVLFDDSNTAIFDENPRIARFTLNDEDRKKLGDAKYLRLIAVYSGTQAVSGRVLLAPPIVRGAAFRPIEIDSGNTVTPSSLSGGNVQAKEIRETGSDSLASRYGDIIGRLHSPGSSQQALSVNWQDMNSEGESAGADGRIGELPLSNYRVLSFFVKGPARENDTAFEGGTFNFIIARGPESLKNSEEAYIEAEIPLSELPPGEWRKVSIRYQGDNQGISVDGSNSAGRFWYRRQFPNAADEPPAGKSNYAAFFVSPRARKITSGDMSGGVLPAGSFCVDEIILEEPAPLYRLNGGAGVEYQLPGTIVSAGKIPVLSDLALSAAFESELRGDPFTPQRESTSGITGRSNAEISLFGIKMKGNLSLTAADEMFFWDAGHELSRSIGPVSIGESFSASPRDESADHRFNAAVSSIVNGKFEAEAYYDQGREERKWNLALGLTPPAKSGGSSLIPEISVNTSAVWLTRNHAFEKENYGAIWLETWRPMLPDLGGNADGRETKTSVIITEKTKPVGGALSLEGTTNFIKATDITRSQNKVRFDLPLSLQSTSVNLQMERGFRQHLRYSSSDVLDDGRKFGEGIRDSLPLWGVIPLYSLFTPALNEAMDKGIANSPSAGLAEYTWFNDIFGITAQLPPFYDTRAFYIPANAAFSIERVLEQKLDTRLDILNLRGRADFSAINIFGAMGYKPLFKFYQSDEFSHSLETVFALPSEEDISYRIQWSAGAAFQGFKGGELGFANTLTTAPDSWLESLRLDWLVPTKRSLLSIFYSWISRKVQSQQSWLTLSALMDAPHEQLRKESLEFTYSRSKDYFSWDISLKHESIIQNMGRLYFSVFGQLVCGYKQQTETLSFTGTIGTTLNIFF